MRGLTETSKRKAYVGYGGAGMVLAGCTARGSRLVAHGPVAQDILRDAGDSAVARTLTWMIDRAPQGIRASSRQREEDGGL